MAEQKRMQERLLVPVVFGEWGGFRPDSEWFYHCHHIQSLFDKWHWSNTYWAYFDGLFESPIMTEVLCRPYPRAVTGEIVDYCHSREENIFKITYRQTKEFSVPTEIFAHKPVKSVTVDGRSDAEYEIRPLDGCDCSVVIIKTGVGTHSVRIEF
jgi:endoglycosylceramidase